MRLMGSKTSITMTEETKSLLETVKRGGETWDDCLQRLANSDESSAEAPAIAKQLEQLREEVNEGHARIEDELNHIPDRVASELTR